MEALSDPDWPTQPAKLYLPTCEEFAGVGQMAVAPGATERAEVKAPHSPGFKMLKYWLKR